MTTKMTQQSATANQPTKGTNGIGKHTRFLQKKAIPKPALSSAQSNSRVSKDPRSAQSTWCHPPTHTWVFSKNLLVSSNSLLSVLRAGEATRTERPHPSGWWAGPVAGWLHSQVSPLGGASAPDVPSAPTTLLAKASCPPRTSASLCVSQSFAHNLGPQGPL